MIRTLRALGLASGLATLAACGGGGGGSNAPAAAPAPTPAPSAPPPFAFTAENATDEGSLLMRGLEETNTATVYPVVIADLLSQLGRTEYTVPCPSGTAQLRFSYVDKDSSSKISAGDVLRFEYPKCGSYTVDISFTVAAITLSTNVPGSLGTIAALTGSGTFDVVYSPTSSILSVGGLLKRIAAGGGVLAIPDAEQPALGEVLMPLAADMRARSAPDSVAGVAVHVQGSFKLAYDRDSATFSRRWQTSDLTLTITRGGTVETLTGGTLDRTAALSNAYRLSFSGVVDSQRLATRVAFSTPVPFEGAFGDFPSSGELSLTAGNSRVRLVPSADPMLGHRFLDVQIDASGAGYVAAQPVDWTSLLLGVFFGWIPNDPPVISQLRILPDEPSANDTLIADYTASDPNNDPVSVTFEWNRNGTVVASSFSNQLPASGFKKGDVIQVKLTASDNKTTATKTATTTLRNAPPSFTDVAITPADPHTFDELRFTAVASDADADPITIAYEWKRNGVVVAGQTGPTFPASAQQRGDSIAVSMTASDGTATATAQATTLILDSPATLAVASPPGGASYGSLVQFTVTAADPDGDAIDPPQFLLTHGPAGMTVDPVTGKVTWTARPPMFDRTMDVHWGVGLANDAAAVPVGGTLTVTDAARHYPLMRTGIEIPIFPAGLSVGDFDGDGDQEIMILSNRSLYELETNGAGGYRQAWMYPFKLAAEFTGDPYYGGLSNMTAMATSDADGDGKQEIYVAAGQSLYKLDGVERRVVKSVPIATASYCKDLQVANLDGVGEKEVVCLVSGPATDPGMIVFGANDLAVRWQFPYADYGRAIDIGNVDNDAALEIVTSAGYVFDGATYQNEWLYGPGFGQDVDTGDLDGDGVDEIVAIASSAALRAYSAKLKSPLWEPNPGSFTSFDTLLVTNIDGDARKEIVTGDNQWGNVTGYKYNAATNTADVVFQINSQDHGVTAIAAGDVDHDGALEFVWGTGATSSGADKLVIAGRNPAIEVEWTNTNPIQLDGPFVGGELARTTLIAPAPLFATARTNSGYDGTRLIRLDPSTGDLTVSEQLGSNWNGTAALAVSDYDNDGVDEVFLSTSDLYDGYLTAYDFFGAHTEWTSPKLPSLQSVVAVAHADLTNDGNDDLIALSSSGVVSVHDVFTQTLVWQSTTLGPGRAVAVADVNQDGTPDIVVATDSAIFVYERIAGPITYVQTANYLPPFSVRDVAIDDADGDGHPEVIALLGSSYFFDQSSRVERLSPSLQQLSYFETNWRSETVVVEPSGAPHKNLLLPRQEYDSTTEIRAVDAIGGQEVWRSPALAGQVSRGGLHFVQIGGETRLAIGTQGGMYLTR